MTTIPAGAKKPADHQKSAAQIEAEGAATVDVEWRDHTFTLPSDLDDVSVTTILAFEEGRVATAIRGLLGAAQWAEFMKTEPVTTDLRDLFDTFGPAMGLGTTGE